MPRTFSSSRISFSLGGYVGTGAVTIAFILYRTAGGAFQAILNYDNGREWNINNSNQPYFFNNGSAVNATMTIPTNVWCLVVWSKATGTSTITFYKYDYSTGVLTTETPAGTVGNGRDGTTLYIGERSDAANPYTGDIAVAGLWDRQLAAEEVANLAFDLDGWRAPAGGAPKALWVLNQANIADAVQDAVGTSNQTAITATTVSPRDVPGFDYGYRRDRPFRMPLGV